MQRCVSKGGEASEGMLERFESRCCRRECHRSRSLGQGEARRGKARQGTAQHSAALHTSAMRYGCHYTVLLDRTTATPHDSAAEHNDQTHTYMYSLRVLYRTVSTNRLNKDRPTATRHPPAHRPTPTTRPTNGEWRMAATARQTFASPARFPGNLHLHFHRHPPSEHLIRHSVHISLPTTSHTTAPGPAYHQTLPSS